MIGQGGEAASDWGHPHVGRLGAGWAPGLRYSRGAGWLEQNEGKRGLQWTGWRVGRGIVSADLEAA